MPAWLLYRLKNSTIDCKNQTSAISQSIIIVPHTLLQNTRTACCLWADGHLTGRVDGRFPGKRLKNHPYFTQTGRDRNSDPDQFIANMSDGAAAGFKYFTFDGSETNITVRGKGNGTFLITNGEKEIVEVPINTTRPFHIEPGIHPLYFTYKGIGTADFFEFEIR